MENQNSGGEARCSPPSLARNRTLLSLLASPNPFFFAILPSLLHLAGRFFLFRELSRKEAVRTKRSLRAFREAWDALLALTTGLARLGIIPPSPLGNCRTVNR